LIAATSGLLATPPTFSQTTDFSETEVRFDLDVTGVLASSSDESGTVLFDLDARLELERITDSGRLYGLVLGGRVERDRGRVAWGGLSGACPSGSADCPPAPLRGYTSGLYAEGAAETDDAVRVALQAGYVFVHSGWGEWRLGYGAGAAAIDAVGGPTAFRTSAADDGRLDISGLNTARTRNRVSGFAPKLVFRSIALGQSRSVGSVRASVSFTPRAGACGVDYCDYGEGPAGILVAQPENIVEIGGRYEIRRGEHTLEVSLGTARGEDGSGLAWFDGVETYDLGARWDMGAWRAGARWLHSNNAVSGAGDYEALSASIGYESGPWMTTLEWAGFSDDLVHTDGRTWQVGTSWLGDHWLIGGGVQYAEREEPVLTGLGRRPDMRDSTGFFLEASWRY